MGLSCGFSNKTTNLGSPYTPTMFFYIILNYIAPRRKDDLKTTRLAHLCMFVCVWLNPARKLNYIQEYLRDKKLGTQSDCKLPKFDDYVMN